MKRLIVLILAMGFVAAADQRTWAARDEEKPKDKKEDKKDDKPKDKKEDDKSPPKEEVKLSEEQKKELERLSGTFSVTTFERDGKKSTDEELKKMKVVQKGPTWTFYLGEEKTSGKDVVLLDTTPKQINSTYVDGEARGETVKGIYKIEGDSITYCWAEVKKDRPTGFETKAGSGLTLMVLKRVEDKKGDDKPKDKPKDKEKAEDKDKPKEKKDKPKDKDKDKE